jgi:hypothetical protein
MTPRKLALLCGLAMILPATAWCLPKPHVVAIGGVRKQPYSAEGDPAGARKDETELKVRPLMVDGKTKDWTTGDAHDLTVRSFAVRRAVRLNDALPTDKAEKWVWQRGPWIVVDRTSGKVTALRLPDFDPAVSDVVWFRDYAAYCGVNASGKQLMAMVAQVEGRKPLLAKKLGDWEAADHASPVCAPAVWQREPLRVSFQVTGAASVSFDLVGTSAVLVEEDDGSE